MFTAVYAWAHSHGICLLRYLDDLLVLGSSEAAAKKNVQDPLSLCHSLGIVINEKSDLVPLQTAINEKSDLVPLQTANYLSMTINTAARIFPALERVKKFLSMAESFRALSAPPAQLWQVLLGPLASLARLVPHSRLRMRSVQWHLKMHWSPELDPPLLPVPLSREVRKDLSWWMVWDHILKGVRFGTPAPDLHLYSDASRLGWGAQLDHVMSGVWSEPEKLLHISLLEMKAMLLALQSFQEMVTSRRVTAMCDNSTIVAYVNKQGGAVSSSLCSLVSRLLRWTESRHPTRCEVSTRAVQCSGRSSQPPGPSPRDRVVSPPAGGDRSALHLGLPVAGLVHDASQREASPILFPRPRSLGSLRGCVSPSLGQPGRLCASSLSSGQKGGGSP